MWSWLARRLGLTSAAEKTDEAQRSLVLRVAELEEHVDWLHGSLRRLRGKLTGGLRGDPEPTDQSKGADPVNGPRGNPQAIELLKKRGRM